MRWTAGSASGAAVCPAARPAHTVERARYRPHRRALQLGGADLGVLFCHGFWPGAAADLHGVGHPGRCPLVFLPAVPASAPIVRLLAGQPPADPAHPALSGSFSLAADKKTFAPVQKMLPFLQNLVYNSIIVLPWGSIPKLAGQEMEGAQ